MIAEPYFKQFFNEVRPDLSVIIDDNGNVAYAYLLEGETIRSDVWLYNCIDTPAVLDFSTEVPLSKHQKFTDNQMVVTNYLEIEEAGLDWVIEIAMFP